MSIEPDDWFNKFFSFGNWPSRRRGSDRDYFEDMFRGFDEMRRGMERQFEETFKNIQTSAPKDLVREYETPEGEKVREIGPIVYGYSMTIGPDGNPRVKEFGNVKSPMRGGSGSFGMASISSEREPLSNVSITDKEVRVAIEMPGVSKENIKIQAYDDKVEVPSNDPQRKYHEVIQIPPEADIETVKSAYNNGILEIVFKRKEQAKSSGKEIRIE
ncbi:MAG: Hsp20/alpha crystallin family protein [Thermoproteota archaeon]|nr:Hsp20/alpha crystallin family protein [Thermoproteota archaeon]